MFYCLSQRTLFLVGVVSRVGTPRRKLHPSLLKGVQLEACRVKGLRRGSQASVIKVRTKNEETGGAPDICDRFQPEIILPEQEGQGPRSSSPIK
jgi:hypothetical protein